MWAGLPSGASKSIPDGERPTATAGPPGPGRRAWNADDPSAEEGAESLAYETLMTMRRIIRVSNRSKWVTKSMRKPMLAKKRRAKKKEMN
jgi:hypothetical protein